MTRIRGKIQKINDTRQSTPGALVQTQISGQTSDVIAGNVGVLPARINFTFTGSATATTTVYIENTHATQNLFVSFNGGTSYKTLVPGQNYSIDIKTTFIIVYGSGVATTYEISYVY